VAKSSGGRLGGDQTSQATSDSDTIAKEKVAQTERPCHFASQSNPVQG